MQVYLCPFRYWLNYEACLKGLESKTIRLNMAKVCDNGRNPSDYLRNLARI